MFDQTSAIHRAHPSWHTTLNHALNCMDRAYLNKLAQSHQWLPGIDKLFNAFSIDKARVRTILLGESPYPRAESANGYAFWDAAVTQLWSDKGLSTSVNRATSLRNFIKMLLIQAQLITTPSQAEIQGLDKTALVQTADELFSHLLDAGFLLLNASLVLNGRVRDDALAWQPFTRAIFESIYDTNPQCTTLLLGRHAQAMRAQLPEHLMVIEAEHPYNLSFIHNQTIGSFFKPLNLLIKKSG